MKKIKLKYTAIYLICFAIFILQCAGDLTEREFIISKEILPDYDHITGHEPFQIIFNDRMDTSFRELSGDMVNQIAEENVNWTLIDGKDVLIIKPSANHIYPAGENQAFTIKCRTESGFEEEISLPHETYYVEYAVYVDDESGSDADDEVDDILTAEGTMLAPKKNIQGGIDYAEEFYTTARVNVVAGDYAVNCALSPSPVYAVEMTEGISIYGGYSVSVDSKEFIHTGAITNIIDDDTSGTGSTEFNPVTAIYCDNSISNATVINGFTITIGSDSGVHSAIYCNYGSPTIEYNVIQGPSVINNSDYSYGILLSYSSAKISYNTIDPGAGQDYARGVYCMNTSTPTIDHNTIYGGTGTNTINISVYTSADAEITNNIIYGGEWSGYGNCIRIASSSPTISANTFNLLIPALTETYAIFEFTASVPAAVTENNFNYTGNWYKDELGAIDLIITISNCDILGNEITTGQGTELLCNATWGNYY